MGSTSGHDAGGDTYDALQRSLLLLVATNALRGAAAPGQYDAMVNGQALAEAMDAAYLQAKARTHPVDKFGYQLGGCAAVMLIQDAGAVFPGRMPDPGPPLGTVAYRGYLAGAAFSLAMAVTEAFQDVILPVWSQPDVRDHFLDLVDEIVADPDYPPRAAITSVVNCLRQFREADEQLAAPPPETMPAPADRSRPRSIPWRPIGITALATVAVLGLLQWMIPTIPYAFLPGGRTGTAAGQAPADPIPLPPGAPTTVSLAQRLPNTKVQLFALADGPSPARGAQTVPGVLPQVSAPVLRINGRMVFQLWLSIRDPHLPPDQLSLSVYGTAPTVVTDSHLMADADHPVAPESHLDAGDFIPVHTIDTGGSPTIYEFVLSAPPDRTTVGYWCGYTAKPVQILVTTSDNASAATTTYPVYVLRDKDC